jgi:uncharacterized protein
VRVGASPEDGKANEALVALLAETLDLPDSSVEIVRGHSSRDKTVAVHGLSEAEVEARLVTFAGAPA